VNLALERIAMHATRLRRPQLAENLPALAEEAARSEWSYTELVERLLAEEVAALDRRTIEMLEKVATLPFGRSLAEFDFGFQPSVKERQLRELASCAFIERRENVIFLGPSGGGQDPPRRGSCLGSPSPAPEGQVHDRGRARHLSR
jgi:DNA replication protein DnaC